MMEISEEKLEPLNFLKEEPSNDFELENVTVKLKPQEIVSNHVNEIVQIDYTTSWILPTWILYIYRLISLLFLLHLLAYHFFSFNFFIYLRDLNLFYVEIYFILIMGLHTLKFAYFFYLKCRRIDEIEKVDTQKMEFYEDSKLKPLVRSIHLVIKVFYPLALINSILATIIYWSFVFIVVEKETVTFEMVERFGIRSFIMILEMIFSIHEMRWWDLIILFFSNVAYCGACILVYSITEIWIWNIFESIDKSKYYMIVLGSFIILFFVIFFVCYLIHFVKIKINQILVKKREDKILLEVQKTELDLISQRFEME